MFNVDVNVKGLCTYEIKEVKSIEKAIIRAIDYFCDDDEFYGTPETENVTEADCEVMWYEEY